MVLNKTLNKKRYKRYKPQAALKMYLKKMKMNPFRVHVKLQQKKKPFQLYNNSSYLIFINFLKFIIGLDEIIFQDTSEYKYPQKFYIILHDTAFNYEEFKF